MCAGVHSNLCTNAQPRHPDPARWQHAWTAWPGRLRGPPPGGRLQRRARAAGADRRPVHSVSPRCTPASQHFGEPLWSYCLLSGRYTPPSFSRLASLPKAYVSLDGCTQHPATALHMPEAQLCMSMQALAPAQHGVTAAIEALQTGLVGLAASLGAGAWSQPQLTRQYQPSGPHVGPHLLPAEAQAPSEQPSCPAPLFGPGRAAVPAGHGSQASPASGDEGNPVTSRTNGRRSGSDSDTDPEQEVSTVHTGARSAAAVLAGSHLLQPLQGLLLDCCFLKQSRLSRLPSAPEGKLLFIRISFSPRMPAGY